MQNVAKYKYLFALFDLLFYILLLDILEFIFQRNHKVTIEFLGIADVHSFWLLIFLLPVFYYIFYYNNLYKLNVVLNRSAHTTALIKSLLYFLPLILIFKIFILNYSHCKIIFFFLTLPRSFFHSFLTFCLSYLSVFLLLFFISHAYV